MENDMVRIPMAMTHSTVDIRATASVLKEMPENAYTNIEKVTNWLYAAEYSDPLDYEFAKEYFRRKRTQIPSGACSAVRKGTVFGGNLDWLYSNAAEFVVKTPDTIGVAGQLNDLTASFVESGEYSALYRLVPFMITDGINRHGIVAKTNVVPLDKGKTVGTFPEKSETDEICALMIPRYVLDGFSTVERAVKAIRNHVSVYVPKTLHEMGYEIQVMLADAESTVVLGFDHNEIVVTDVKDHPYMTNFHVSGVNLDEYGFVTTPETQTEGHTAVTDNQITEHGSGLERYNLIAGMYEDASVSEILETLKYQNAYNPQQDPYWYTEFVGGDLTVESSVEDFSGAVADAQQAWIDRSREHPAVWHTLHSSIYDMQEKSLRITAQDGLEYTFEIGGESL